jgi:PAS domain S-box-containing protein
MNSENKEKKKQILKGLIERLHQGANPDEIKDKFKEILKDVTPTEIAKIEDELIKEGMSADEIQKLCDVHLAVFKESLEKEKVKAPPGHPINILMEEHRIMLNFADTLKNLAGDIKSAKDFDSIPKEMSKLRHQAKHFKESESHYLREENVLFPYIEKHGITQPPKMMWMEHDKIRGIKKSLSELVDKHKDMDFKDFADQLEEVSISLAQTLTDHFYKENNVLFPTSLKIISGNEWNEIRAQFDELGYCCFTPQPKAMAVEKMDEPESKPAAKGMVSFETGTLSFEEIEAIFDSLPVDVTFVDKDDRVRYFSQSKERIFVRTKAVLGLKVQQCHPDKSIHIVNQILEDFKSGKKDVAEFWINFEGKLVYIRYFPVLSKKGEYLGCVEVTQDIANIKKIEGEKRLL